MFQIIYNNKSNVLDKFRKIIASGNINSVSDMYDVISDGGKYNEFINEIGCDDRVKSVLDRQRNIILESSGPESSGYSGFLVMTPVIVVDSYIRSTVKYCTRIISVDSPKFSVTGISSYAKYKSLYDGKLKRVLFPRIFNRLYENYIYIEINPREVVNLLNINVNGLPITRNIYKINSFSLVKINMVENGLDVSYDVNFVLDGRGNLDVDYDNGNFGLKLIGNLNYDTGQFAYDCVVDNPDYIFKNCLFKVNYFPYKSSPIKPEVYFGVDTTDIDIGVLDDFDLVIPPELKQDFFSLYTLDILTEMMNAISLQLSYSSDQDIIDSLTACYIPDYLDIEIDLNKFTYSGNMFRPSGVFDLFSNTLIPAVMVLSDRLEKITGLKPNVLVCGEFIGSMIKYIDYYIDHPFKVNDYRLKEFDIDSDRISVVISPSLKDESKVYLYTVTEILDDKIDNINPIVMFEYIPLYMVQETTGGVFRVNFRSRKKSIIQKPNAIGRIRFKGLEMLW
ncbi:MAG: hypothetical protein QXD03_02180 [Candidatus Anstonellales archaeon]